jgi:DNA-binding transcriptional MocR family regulator
MTERPLPDVCVKRDFPVLVEVTRRIDLREHAPKIDEIADAVGMDREQVARAGAALLRRGLVEAVGEPRRSRCCGSPTSPPRRISFTGLHPSGDDAITNLVSALRQAADHVDDPAEKSRLRTLADQALHVSRDVLGGVLVAVMTGQTP